MSRKGSVDPEAWRGITERYRHFAKAFASASQFLQMDFSDHSSVQMFRYETFGEENLAQTLFVNGAGQNGYAFGKRCQDIQLSLWREGIQQGFLTKAELLDDPSLQVLRPWLDDQLSRMPSSPSVLYESYDVLSMRAASSQAPEPEFY